MRRALMAQVRCYVERNRTEVARNDSFSSLFFDGSPILEFGYRSHFEELQLLPVYHKPPFLCLQETHLLPEHHLRLRGYVCYRKDTVGGLCAHGGVAILVHDSIHSQEIALQSTLQLLPSK